MVLENSSIEEGTVSDVDPYDTQAAPGRPGRNYHIDVAALPKPMPIFGPLFGYNQKLFEKVLHEKLVNGAHALGRPPTQEEAEATAFWTAKQISIISYGSPIGVAGGWWRAWNTASTYRFPFWQPNPETFNPLSFPPAMGTLRNLHAMIAWHALRALAYGVVGNYVGQIIIGSYSISTAAVGELSDKRLTAMVNAVRQQAQQRRGGLPSPTQQRAAGMARNQPDDASPTAGMYGDESSETGSDIGRLGMSDDKLQEDRTRTWPRPSKAPQMEPYEAQDEGFVFDDASPTGGQGVSADTAPHQMSAWERLRRGEKPVPSGQAGPRGLAAPAQPRQNAWAKLQNNTQPEQGGLSASESYTFSETDEDRNVARAQAQKEFDAQVDRERRGGDFNSGAERRRW
ncbi:hypothetical protein M430DRAFT_193408 [Amorphotheca resinae ATCC 22711]|jgi:hypothetical protein|uniref:Uncharacterized protein n=1 Tax=Amorphotheca resinae ATCC 22711 TaxID=857342 RepID=A0A2T3AQ59_AMORE|nr:hypothetical protein M430DRAFT_193408 [Amorphotheca resinae ATCC 22711]PSS07135.1 hypothetical protein M430DRAFT_193408 [Amorphotheca resinae ATCC 22711]